MDKKSQPEESGSKPDSDPLYFAVVEQHAESVFSRARETLATGGSIDEPGLLRLVLARLLTSEHETSRLAARAADLANAVARLVTIQRQGGERDDGDLPKAVRDVQKEIAADREGPSHADSTVNIPEGAPR
jgi:hypothetical protein